MNKLFIKVKNNIYLQNVKLLWGNQIFNVALFLPICITSWNTIKNNSQIIIEDTAFTNSIYKVNDINNISIHGDFSFIKQNFLNKIENCDSLLNHIYYINQKVKYLVRFSSIRGHVPFNNSKKLNDDFFTLISKDYFINLSANLTDWKKEKFLCFNFQTQKEQINFVNYCKTKFVRFCLSILKISGGLNRGQEKYIPWLNFKYEWTDQKLCKKFNITKEFWNYIDKFIPKYY